MRKRRHHGSERTGDLRPSGRLPSPLGVVQGRRSWNARGDPFGGACGAGRGRDAGTAPQKAEKRFSRVARRSGPSLRPAGCSGRGGASAKSLITTRRPSASMLRLRVPYAASAGTPACRRVADVRPLPAQPAEGAPIRPVDLLALEPISGKEDCPGYLLGMAAHWTTLRSVACVFDGASFAYGALPRRPRPSVR
jgi:hypothetical protein